ncbi:MAG: hypothetical protein ACRDHU_06385 [Actinomycetota bacterium]
MSEVTVAGGPQGDITIVEGPLVESRGALIYQITLTSGMIVTDPSAFSRREALPASDVPVFAESGQPLVVPR